MHLGRRYALNFIRNLPLLSSAPSVEQIDFGNKPLLVLGAGPSLDDFLETFTTMVPKALEGSHPEVLEGTRPFGIICVDTALPALKARNIKPDMVVVLEAQHWNLRDFIGMNDWQLPVAMDLSSLPATSEQLGNQTYLFTTPWTELSIFQRLKNNGLSPLCMPPLGSVGLSAVFLALKISSGMIISAGLDFSFTIDSYHAKETPSWLFTQRKQTRLNGMIPASLAFRKGAVKITAKNGSSVFTDPGLQNYRDLFEQEFANGDNVFSKDRLYDIHSLGLPLCIKTVEISEAIRLLLKENNFKNTELPSMKKEYQHERVKQFIHDEYQCLHELKLSLTGKKNTPTGKLEELLCKTDYLWAHFPDYAGKNTKTPPINDLSFLKRVRTEIDPFLKIMENMENR